MDREMLQRHLTVAERHVTEGQKRVDRQRALLAELIRAGRHDLAKFAKALLIEFQKTQKLYVADRDRIIRWLSESQAEE